MSLRDMGVRSEKLRKLEVRNSPQRRGGAEKKTLVA
jgi:hypothetical protein